MTSNWKILNFESCLNKISYSNKIQKKDFLQSGDFPIISQEAEFINGYCNNKKDIFELKKPVVLFGDHTKIFKYIDFNFALGADGVKILEPKDFLDSKFLYYFLKGTDLKNLGYARHYKLLREINIKYPESIQEQRRIAIILDEVFKNIEKAKENLEKNLENTKEFFEEYLRNVFINKNNNWKGKKLKEVCDIINGGTPDTSKNEYWGNDYFWVTPKDMGKLNSIFVNETERKISELGLKNSSAKILPEKSIILSSRAPIGYLAINNVKMATNQGCKGLVPKKELNYNFLFYFLLNSRDLLNSLGSGATFKELSGSKLSDIDIFLPDIDEQKNIVEKLDKLSVETDNLEENYKQKLVLLEELKKSILSKAFNSEL